MDIEEIRKNAPCGASYSFILNKYVKTIGKELWLWNGYMWKHNGKIKHPREITRLQIKPLN